MDQVYAWQAGPPLASILPQLLLPTCRPRSAEVDGPRVLDNYIVVSMAHLDIAVVYMYVCIGVENFNRKHKPCSVPALQKWIRVNHSNFELSTPSFCFGGTYEELAQAEVDLLAGLVVLLGVMASAEGLRLGRHQLATSPCRVFAARVGSRCLLAGLGCQWMLCYIGYTDRQTHRQTDRDTDTHTDT